MSTAKSLTHLYLEHDQKSALKALADRNGVSLAEEARKAIDAWLASQGLTPSPSTYEQDVKKTVELLTNANNRLDAVMARIDNLLPG